MNINWLQKLEMLYGWKGHGLIQVEISKSNECRSLKKQGNVS